LGGRDGHDRVGASAGEGAGELLGEEEGKGVSEVRSGRSRTRTRPLFTFGKRASGESTASQTKKYSLLNAGYREAAVSQAQSPYLISFDMMYSHGLVTLSVTVRRPDDAITLQTWKSCPMPSEERRRPVEGTIS
jgi:hypothetical protein